MIVPVAAIFAVLLAGCGGKKDPAGPEDHMSSAERYEKGLEQLAKRDLRKARQTLERITVSDDAGELEPLVRLAIADATFYAGDELSLIDARPLYEDFVVLYGDHDRAPYAKLQSGVCLLEQVNHPSRDQSMTHESIQVLQEVMRRFPGSSYAPVAEVKIENARNNLAEHEFLVGKFYMKKKAYLPAENRFRSVLLNYPSYPERDKLYFHLGKALVLADNMEEGRIYLGKLVESWPDSPYASEAGKLLGRESAGQIRKQVDRRKKKEQNRADKRIKQAERRMEKAKKKIRRQKK